MEMQIELETISQLYGRLLESEPKLISNYVPENTLAEKAEFLSGHSKIPDHNYDKLGTIDFSGEKAKIRLIGRTILAHPDLNPKHASAYEEFVDDYDQKTSLMELAHTFKNSSDETEKTRLEQDFMQLNIELYGEPVEATYRSILQEKLNLIEQKQLAGSALQLRDELFEMVAYVPGANKLDRFLPSDETVEWMHVVAENLYGDMLSHIPEQAKFSITEVRDIFAEIIELEIGEAAAGWTVDIEPARSIDVKPTEQRIVLPEDRGNISYQQLRGLVVHEIGVHLLRSVMGGETDLPPLQYGLSGYLDFEEGLGVVMEQALKGKFSESGLEHYLTAGLAYYDNKNFRDTFEVKWRLSALAAAVEGADITDAVVTKAKNTAYGSVMRSMRGTDELPWFKDLAYYNGSIDVWRHLQSIKGDDLKLMFLLLGKTIPSSRKHERILLETKTI